MLEGLLTGRLDAALVDGPLELAGLDGVMDRCTKIEHRKLAVAA